MVLDSQNPVPASGNDPSKRREVHIWLTILHSMESPVQWDQWVWNGDMANAKVEMGSNTDRDKNVETILQKFWDVNIKEYVRSRI